MKIQTQIPGFVIREASVADVPLILAFIRDLAEYEKLIHEVVATEETLRETLFGNRKIAEVVFGELDQEPVSFALFFHNFSTFLGRPGIYLEDLFVKPEMRGKGIGKMMLAYLAKLAKDRNCGRLEWWDVFQRAPNESTREFAPARRGVRGRRRLRGQLRKNSSHTMKIIGSMMGRVYLKT